MRPSLISSAKWQSTSCPLENLRSGGTSSRQRGGSTNGQRVWKRQAAGGFAGLGKSPASRIGSRCREEVPPLRKFSSGHEVACHFAEEIKEGRIKPREREPVFALPAPEPVEEPPPV